MLRQIFTNAELSDLGLDGSTDEIPTPPGSIKLTQFFRVRHFLFLHSLIYWSALAWTIYSYTNHSYAETRERHHLARAVTLGVALSALLATWECSVSLHLSPQWSGWSVVSVLLGLCGRLVIWNDLLVSTHMMNLGFVVSGYLAAGICVGSYGVFVGFHQIRLLLALSHADDDYTIDSMKRALKPALLFDMHSRGEGQRATFMLVPLVAVFHQAKQWLSGWMTPSSIITAAVRRRARNDVAPKAPTLRSYPRLPSMIDSRLLAATCRGSSLGNDEAVARQEDPSGSVAGNAALGVELTSPPTDASLGKADGEAGVYQAYLTLPSDTPLAPRYPLLQHPGCTQRIAHSENDPRPIHYHLNDDDLPPYLRPFPSDTPPSRETLRDFYLPSYYSVILIFWTCKGLVRLSHQARRIFAPLFSLLGSLFRNRTQQIPQRVSETTASLANHADRYLCSSYTPVAAVRIANSSRLGLCDTWLTHFESLSRLAVPAHKVIQMCALTHCSDCFCLQDLMRQRYLPPDYLELHEFNNAIMSVGRCFLADILLTLLKCYFLTATTPSSEIEEATFPYHSFILFSLGLSLWQSFVMCLCNTIDEDVWQDIMTFD